MRGTSLICGVAELEAGCGERYGTTETIYKVPIKPRKKAGLVATGTDPSVHLRGQQERGRERERERSARRHVRPARPRSILLRGHCVSFIFRALARITRLSGARRARDRPSRDNGGERRRRQRQQPRFLRFAMQYLNLRFFFVEECHPDSDEVYIRLTGQVG